MRLDRKSGTSSLEKAHVDEDKSSHRHTTAHPPLSFTSHGDSVSMGITELTPTVISLPGVEHDIEPSNCWFNCAPCQNAEGCGEPERERDESQGPRDHIFLVFFHLPRRLATALVRETLK